MIFWVEEKWMQLGLGWILVIWDEEEIQGGGRDEGWVVTFCVN